MAIPAFLLPLLGQGLSLISNAAMVKGKDWVQQKTGVDLNQVNLSNEDILKLKQYESEHKLALEKIRQEDDRLGLEAVKLMLQDKDSSRRMQETALQQEDLFSKRFIYYFAAFWSIAAVLYIGCITFMEVPLDNVRFADTVLGFVLGTVIATIIGFFYGSSAGSQSKTNFLEEVAGRVSKK
jgi:hypothetical protein